MKRPEFGVSKEYPKTQNPYSKGRSQKKSKDGIGVLHGFMGAGGEGFACPGAVAKLTAASRRLRLSGGARILTCWRGRGRGITVAP